MVWLEQRHTDITSCINYKHKLLIANYYQVVFRTDFDKWDSKLLGFSSPVEHPLLYISEIVTRGCEKSLTSLCPSINQVSSETFRMRCYLCSLHYQYLHPLEAKPCLDAVRALRNMGRQCIQRRIKDIENGEQPPKDIFTAYSMLF